MCSLIILAIVGLMLLVQFILDLRFVRGVDTAALERAGTDTDAKIVE